MNGVEIIYSKERCFIPRNIFMNAGYIKNIQIFNIFNIREEDFACVCDHINLFDALIYHITLLGQERVL